LREIAVTLEDIAAELVAGCRENRTAENLDKLYAEDAVSVESRDMGSGRECAGLAGIKAKHEWWDQNMEMSGGSVSDPFLHGEDRFAVIFEAQGRDKASGNPFEMKEVAVYHVSGGKIVREEFFY
jgi:ketosteroid isomerase-like protein